MQTQENKPFSPIADESSYVRETEERSKQSEPMSNCCNAQEKRLDGVYYLKLTIRGLQDATRRGDELAKMSSKHARDLQILLDCLPSKLDENANNGLMYLLRGQKL